MPSWVSHAPIASHGRRRLEAENLVLRHQLNVLQQRAPRRLYLRWADRALFVWLYRRCPRILSSITIVRPETVVRWHRMGFATYWRWKSRPHGGRPRTAGIETVLRQSFADDVAVGHHSDQPVVFPDRNRAYIVRAH